MKKSIIISIILSIILSGCGIVKFSRNDNASASPGGLFKTINAGDEWIQKGALYSVNGQQSVIAFNSISSLQFDPIDENTLYLGTDNGLYYSYNRGEGWFRTLANKGVVNGLAIDPFDKCTIYVLVHNTIYKSSDCSRTWTQVHFSSLKGEFFNTILVSNDDSNTVFVGSSSGALLESNNAGRSWRVKQYMDSPITRFVAHPFDPKAFYMVTKKFGIQKTTNKGVSWTTLNELPVHSSDGQPILDAKGNIRELVALSGSNVFFDLKFDRSQKDGLLYASSYGIFRLINDEYWQEIDILNKPRKQKIYSIALDSTDGQTIYFATAGAFYQSLNGGEDWTVRPLPSPAIPKFMLLAPDNSREAFVVFSPTNQ